MHIIAIPIIQTFLALQISSTVQNPIAVNGPLL